MPASLRRCTKISPLPLGEGPGVRVCDSAAYALTLTLVSRRERDRFSVWLCQALPELLIRGLDGEPDLRACRDYHSL